MISVLIVDDEFLARERIRQLLERLPALTVCGEAADGQDAVHAIERCRPDILLLDVELPEMNGFEVLECLGEEDTPTVIFMTAYDQYAARAFTVHALDYLLKPVEPARFVEAMERACRSRQDSDPRAERDRLRALIEARPRTSDRIVVRTGDRVLFLRPTEIDWIEAVGNYVKLHRGAETFLTRQTMRSLEEALPQTFARIHKSTIVNSDRVAELRHDAKDSYVVVLQTGVRFPLSPLYRKNLERALGRF